MLRIFILLVFVFVSACQKKAPPEPRRMPVMNYSKTYQTPAGQAQPQMQPQTAQTMPPMPLQAPIAGNQANGGGQANLQLNEEFASPQEREMKSWEQPVPNPTYDEHNSVFAFPGLFGKKADEPELQKRRPVGYQEAYGNDMPSAPMPPAEPRNIEPRMSDAPRPIMKSRPTPKKEVENREFIKPRRIERAEPKVREKIEVSEPKPAPILKQPKRRAEAPKEEPKVQAKPKAQTTEKTQPIPPLRASDKTEKIPSDMKTYQEPIAAPVDEETAPQEIGSMEVIETKTTSKPRHSSSSSRKPAPPARRQRYLPSSRYSDQRQPKGSYMRHPED